jgi:hypothetical protein
MHDVGTTSPEQTVTITNTSSAAPVEAAMDAVVPKVAYGAPVNIKSVTVSGDYAQENNCKTLNPGKSCTVKVTFSPTATGERPGTLSVESDASNPLLTVGLTGIGSTPLPAIQFSVGSVSFGSGVMGRPAGEHKIVVKSVGRADLHISSLYMVGDFVQTNDCPAVLAPGAECTVTVSFLASIPGDREGKLVVLSNAPPGVAEVGLTGHGCRPYSPSGPRLSDPGCS